MKGDNLKNSFKNWQDLIDRLPDQQKAIAKALNDSFPAADYNNPVAWLSHIRNPKRREAILTAFQSDFGHQIAYGPDVVELASLLYEISKTDAAIVANSNLNEIANWLISEGRWHELAEFAAIMDSLDWP